MARDWDEIEEMRERMRDSAIRSFSSGDLSQEELDGVFERISGVISEEDIGRLGLVRFYLADPAVEDGSPGEVAGHAPGTATAERASMPPAAVGNYGPPSSFTFLGDSRHALAPGQRGLSSTILIGDTRVDCVSSGEPRIDLDIVSLVGDLIVTVPADYHVVNQMTCILGEMKDRQLDPSTLDRSKAVRLTGFHLLGDLKIKRV
jgi:hypothetical protein